MITAEEREAEFRKDMQELLNKHQVELIITDDGKPYGMHSPILRIEMDEAYDIDNDKLVLPYVEFEW
jgi:hypothetical protein